MDCASQFFPLVIMRERQFSQFIFTKALKCPSTILLIVAVSVSIFSLYGIKQ